MVISQSKRILITFARSFLSLELARQLKKQGHEIFVIDSLKRPLASYSNAVKKSYHAPSPRYNPEGYVDALKDIVVKEKIDLLIPIYEEIACLSKALKTFPKSCKVFCPPFEVYEKLQHKWLFQETLKSLRMPALKTYLLKTPECFGRHDLSEYVLKPCHSRASQFVRKISSSSPPPKIAIEPENPWVAQEWVEGNKYCSYTVCNEGKIHAHSVYPVTYAIGGNSCIVYEAVEHQKIYHWTAELVKKLKITGQVAFDFIERHDGTLFAIECNPRATSGLLLFDPQDRLDQAFLGKPKTTVRPLPGSRKQVAIGMLMYGWRRSALKDNSLKKFASTLLTTQDVVFRMRDLKPFLFEPLIFAKLWMKSRKHGISMPDFYTHDHDWNGKPLPELDLGFKF